MIECKEIVKTFGAHTAVDHLSFRLEKGKIYGFLGPNGAGKSTTMNMMTGYLAPTSGEITINGYDMLKDPEKAKAYIGYLPEIPPLYNDMTVEEYLEFVAELKKIPSKKRRDEVASAEKKTLIGTYADRLIRHLSKGYRQRVGLAQALLGDPEIIILDEPTVGLDPQQIIEIRNLIRSLKEQHLVILSSHILSEVNEVCDEVMIISHGKMEEIGTPAELEAKYAGHATYQIAIIGEEPQVKGALSGLSGIQKVDISNQKKEDGSLLVTVYTKSSEDIRAEIASALASVSLPVLSMTKEEQSLEDVFLKVTASKNKGGNQNK